jgi:hypothetical protein
VVEAFKRAAKALNLSLPQMLGTALENYALDKLGWTLRLKQGLTISGRRRLG